MPELPEVEQTRSSIAPMLIGRRIARVRLARRDVLTLPGEPAGGWSRQRTPAAPRRYRPEHLLAGATVHAVDRHGKQIAIRASDGRALVVQLGMSGSLRGLEAGDKGPADHVHATWWLDDGRRMVFRDPRRFGGLTALPDAEGLDARWRSLGPDALAITGEALRERLAGTARAIKAALLDQATVAGVGNIYADESLFRAGVHPETAGGLLDAASADRLAQAVREVLHAAVQAGGSTLRDFHDAHGVSGAYQAEHAVYGRGGQACVRCGSTLATARIAQRTTVWCPICQPG